jgi:SAM-dependent methyltransferase
MDRAAAFFDPEYDDYADDLPALEAYARRTGGPLLELGCGTGRALIPLAEAGFDVTGVDLSPAMLARAQSRAAAAGVPDRVHLVEGDFASAALTGPYRFAYCVMNTFLHLPDRGAHVAALRHWRQHLATGGLLLIDIFHPDIVQLAQHDGRLEWDKTWQDAETGATVMKYLTRTADLAEQTLHVNMIYDTVSADGQLRRTVAPYDLRYIWRFEGELLLEAAGYTIEGVYGDWDLGPFESASERMIYVARVGSRRDEANQSPRSAKSTKRGTRA